MNRVIKFRGLRANGNGWVYGYIQPHTNPELLDILQLNDDHDWTRYRVKPKTVGQFTGLKDKNDVEIFEGDKFEDIGESGFLLVEWNNEESRFQLNVYDYPMSYGEGSQEVFGSEIELVDENVIDMSCVSEFEVIGNIHEGEVQDGK